MARLEDLTVNAVVRGLVPNSTVTIKHVRMFGSEVANVTFVDAEGRAGTQLVYRNQESSLEVLKQTRPLSFTADGHLFRLASEAQRLRLAFLFDPMIAVSTSSVEPLPQPHRVLPTHLSDRRFKRFAGSVAFTTDRERRRPGSRVANQFWRRENAFHAGPLPFVFGHTQGKHGRFGANLHGSKNNSPNWNTASGDCR